LNFDLSKVTDAEQISSKSDFSRNHNKQRTNQQTGMITIPLVEVINEHGYKDYYLLLLLLLSVSTPARHTCKRRHSHASRCEDKTDALTHATARPQVINHTRPHAVQADVSTRATSESFLLRMLFSGSEHGPSDGCRCCRISESIHATAEW